MKTYNKDGYNYTPASRWIKVEYKIITPRHSLYDYADGIGFEEYGTNKELKEVCCFRHSGKWYALNQFMRLSYPIMLEDNNGIIAIIGGYDATNYYKPYLIEIHPNGESIRLWNESTQEV